MNKIIVNGDPQTFLNKITTKTIPKIPDADADIPTMEVKIPEGFSKPRPTTPPPHRGGEKSVPAGQSDPPIKKPFSMSDIPCLNIESVNKIQNSTISKTMKSKCLAMKPDLLDNVDAIYRLVELLETKKPFKKSLEIAFQ